MSVERENAVVNNSINLRNNFKYSQTNDYFDPFAISKVEILDSDGVTVLQTITGASIIKDAVGRYYVVASVISTPKTIYDKWYFTPAIGATAITKTNTCVVWATAAEAGTETLSTDNASLLTAVNNAIAARLNGGAVDSYTIGGRDLKYIPLADLFKMRDNLRREIAAGAGGARNYISFRRPS